ncbi:radical SAM protein [Dermabacter sp. Marseille-Q3180]|uniref:radical SAM/SPASM domain-containing protein n=1 Tax=Dermabacter sp. Marseille-Q3180 TaxID=2758090 RepID=UPI002024479C|nr:radical SAM protein [Dermabacter sp. Marseille-Q3180]
MKFADTLALDTYTKARSKVSAAATRAPILSELVLNISEGCNLTCGYCFAKEGLYSEESPAWMSREHSYRYTQQMLESHPNISRIKLFGGEPFMNIPAITGFVDAFEEHLARNPDRHKQISVGCVTNLTIYSAKLVDLIKRANIRITASIDGPREIHDLNRRFRNGRGSFDRIISVAKRYADSGISIDGVECVYSPAHKAAGISMLDLHEFILSILNPRRVILTPLQAALPDEHPEQVDFAAWIRETATDYVRECVRRKEEHVSYRAITEDNLGVLFGPKSTHGWCALGRSTCTVTADGTVVPCYTLLDHKNRWTLGHLSDTSFMPSMRSEDIFLELQQATPLKASECQDCDIKEVCRGCPGAVYAQREVFTGRDSISCNYRIGSLEGLIDGWKLTANQG